MNMKVENTIKNTKAMSATKSLIGTETQKYLATSYLAESTAVTRYTFFADKAEKDGFPQYSEIFKETAANELRHAKIFLQFLCEANAEAPAMSVDAGVIGETLDNLKVAATEEEHEGVELYTTAAAVARKEGFDDIADRFAAIATIEAHHRDRFLAMARRIEEGTVWRSESGDPIEWQCRVCGYIYEGVTPPEECPACHHPQKYFERIEANY